MCTTGNPTMDRNNWCTFSDAHNMSELMSSSTRNSVACSMFVLSVHSQKDAVGCECSCQTYNTQYVLTVAVIQSSSRDTIFSKKARARPSLTSSNIPVVLTSKCLQQHTSCDQKQLSHNVNLWHMLQLATAPACSPEHAGNTAAHFAVCRSDSFNLSALLITPCCTLEMQCTAFTQQECVV